jgi:hypothetical protein
MNEECEGLVGVGMRSKEITRSEQWLIGTARNKVHITSADTQGTKRAEMSCILAHRRMRCIPGLCMWTYIGWWMASAAWMRLCEVGWLGEWLERATEGPTVCA